MPSPLGHLRCLHALVLLTTIVGAGFGCMDGLTAPPSEQTGRATVPVPERAFHSGSRRVFVLILDSMPERIATDPDYMPNLVAMRPRGASGPMVTVHDAVSVPAMRAAFTGTDRVAVFGFVKNLWHGEEGFESLFTQVREAGLEAVVYSDGTFRQFGGDLPDQRDIGHGLAEELRNIEEAKQSFVAGEHDFVILHVIFTDTVAHEVGVHADRYREEFALADQLVGEIDAAIPDDATLLIMGDHGHDDMGRHLPGMDVPTFALIRGPGHEPGAELVDLRIQDLRYLLSWALKIPLVGSYAAGRHPDALRGTGMLPPSFARDESVATETAAPRPWAGFALVTLAIAILVSLWVNLVRPRTGDDESRATRIICAWIALVFLGASGGNALAAGTSAIVAAIGLAIPLFRSRPTKQDLAWTFLPASIVLAVPWGAALSALNPIIGWPRHRNVVVAWMVAIGLGVAISRRIGAVTTAWIILGASMLLLPPTVYHYGFPSAMVPLWAAFLLLVALDHRRFDARPKAWLLIPLAVLLVPFALVFSTNFAFEEWYVPFVRLWLWGRAEQPAHVVGIALAFAAKLVIFMPRRGGAPALAVAAALVCAIAVVQLNWTGLTPELMPKLTYLACIAVGAAATWATRRVHAGAWNGVHRALLLATLYALYFYAVRLDVKFYLWMDCLLAALIITGRFVSPIISPSQRPAVGCYLLLIAATATAWVSSAWTFHRLEWGFLFDWFEVRFVERTAGFFALLIAIRLCIPLIIARQLLWEALGSDWVYPQRWITVLVGLTIGGSLLVALGMGFHEPGSDAYLEAVQQTAIWTFVVTALPWRPKRTRANASAITAARDE